MIKIGVAFGDFIIKDASRKKHNDIAREDVSTRDFFLPVSLAVIFVLLFLKLFSLQVLNGLYYRSLSNSNKTKTIVVHAPRGIIFDRNGNPLTFNVPGFRETVNGKTILLTREEALSLIANGQKNLEVDTLREYPYKDSLAHVVGFIGQISSAELSSPDYSSYFSGDLVGQYGIEKQYEAKLRGTDGKELIEVDAKGNTIRKLGQSDPIPGQNITLTVDAGLQNAVFAAAKDIKKGAIIVSNPKGEILAMLSKPSFDPNLFTMGPSYKETSVSFYQSLDQILTDNQNQPLLNRAISGTYPPGSTFKPIVAAAGLTNGIIDENFEVEDTGIIRIGDFSFANWYYTGYGGTDGMVNVVKGLKRSNDIFFYKLAEKVGIDKISQTAKKFGLGNTLGIDLAGEEGGIVPTEEWKKQQTGEPWYLGDTYHYGIGQGFLLATPLQVNGWTQAIANNGTLYVPHLLKSQPPTIKSQNLLDNHSSDLIREGMIEACNPGGVAWPLFSYMVKNPKLPIDNKNILSVPASSGSADMRQVVLACKTGTAETGDPNANPHAWITLFAPAYNPQIIVTVLEENGGEGSNVAAPIAKEILNYWFSK